MRVLRKGHAGADACGGCFEGVGSQTQLPASACVCARGMPAQTRAVVVSRAWAVRRSFQLLRASVQVTCNRNRMMNISTSKLYVLVGFLIVLAGFSIVVCS